MAIKLAGHLPLQDMIAQTIESAKMKLAAAEEEKKDEKEKEKEKVRKLVEYEKKEHGGKIPTVEEEKVSFVIDLSDVEEVEKLASALDFVAEKLAGDSVEIGGESHQGGMVLPTGNAVSGKQPYKHDKSRTGNIPLYPGMTSDPSQGSASTQMANDANRAPGGNAKGEFKTASVARLQEALEKVAISDATFGSATAHRLANEGFAKELGDHAHKLIEAHRPGESPGPDALRANFQGGRRGHQSEAVREKIKSRYMKGSGRMSNPVAAHAFDNSMKGFERAVQENGGMEGLKKQMSDELKEHLENKSSGQGSSAPPTSASSTTPPKSSSQSPRPRSGNPPKPKARTGGGGGGGVSGAYRPASSSTVSAASHTPKPPPRSLGRAAAAAGATALGYGVYRHMKNKQSSAEESTRDRARRWGTIGAAANLGAGLPVILRNANHHPELAAAQVVGHSLAGYGAGRLVHRLAHGPSSKKEKVKESSVEYILGKIAEATGGGMTLDTPSGQGPKPPADAAGGNSILNILENSQNAINMKKVDGKGPQKRMLAEVLSEPAYAKSTDSKVHENLQNASKGGVKIASAVKVAAARSYLRKIAEEGCVCGDNGECKYCKLQAAAKKEKEKQSEGGMPSTTPPGMSGSM